jgi:UDP-2-acetamido-3-amino-2,3-dideoxy-glucuronate N-acetyltransferase
MITRPEPTPATGEDGAPPRVHPSAEVAPTARIGAGTAVWNEAQVREHARVGRDCVLGKGAFVDAGVEVGDRVKLHTRSSVFAGARIGSGVFVGPHSCLLNDRRPRATTTDGRLKRDGDWPVAGVTVGDGASIGGGCTVLPGVRIGRYAMVGAGSLVSRDVEDHGLVVGSPARLVGYVCRCGGDLDERRLCAECGQLNPGAGERP